MRKSASLTLKKAPKLIAKRGEPLQVTVPGGSPGVSYTVSLKRAGGNYSQVGAVQAGDDGSLAVPVVTMSRRGNYVLAIVGSDGQLHVHQGAGPLGQR